MSYTLHFNTISNLTEYSVIKVNDFIVLWKPPSLIFTGHLGLVSCRQSSWSMKLTSLIWWWDWACVEVVCVSMNPHGVLLRALSAVPILHVPFVLINKTVFRWIKVYLYSIVLWHHSPWWTLASSFRSFSAEHIFMGWGCQHYTHPPTPGYTSLFGSSLLTCLAWDALLVTTLMPA